MGKVHASLGSVPYCHASSPIRRYADIVNQRCLKAILRNQPSEFFPCSQETAKILNLQQKQVRRYERSLFFLEQIAKSPSGKVEGVIVECLSEKTKVYIPAWKQTIRMDPGSYTIGQSVQVGYYADLQKPYWDQRIVFRMEDGDGEHDE